MSAEAMLATWELTKKDLNSLEKLLLLSLARRAGEEHICWPSIKRIEEDTGMDRKTIVSYRQNLINRGFLSYTGEMRGRTNLIPEMRLDYVVRWEIKRNSPRLNDESVDNSGGNKLNSTVDGTANSTVDGTANSTVDGTLNIKGEYKRGNKSSCASPPEKPKPPKPQHVKESIRQQNQKKHPWSEYKQLNVTRGVTDTISEEYKHSLKMPPASKEVMLESYAKLPRYLIPKQYRSLIPTNRIENEHVSRLNTHV